MWLNQCGSFEVSKWTNWHTNYKCQLKQMITSKTNKQKKKWIERWRAVQTVNYNFPDIFLVNASTQVIMDCFRVVFIFFWLTDIWCSLFALCVSVWLSAVFSGLWEIPRGCGCYFVVVLTVMDKWGRWQGALWEWWLGSAGCCSWSINGPVSADLHVTQESIYSLHLIHELQAVCDWPTDSKACFSEIFTSLNPRPSTAGNELHVAGRMWGGGDTLP